MMKGISLKTKLTSVIALMMTFSAFTAQAHTTSQGWIDLGGGNLSFVLGSYDHGGFPAAAGSVTIDGQTFNFTTVVSTKPAGLIDGVNNFYGAFYCGGVLGQYDQPTDACTDTPDYWQIADVSGITPRCSYDFTVQGMNGVQWADDATTAPGWPGSLTLADCVEVVIDIKFCSDPNAFNCKKKGVLPVTIFGTDTFDVTDIDLSTLALCNADLSMCTGTPKDTSVADRGSPSDAGAAQCAIIEVEEGVFEEQDYLNQDTYDDLDAAFISDEVKDIVGDFCTLAKGATSDPLIVTGMTFGGDVFYSVPVPNVGVDQLLKANK